LAIFDGGGAGFVIEEAHKKLGHHEPLLSEGSNRITLELQPG
jgi:hypothetical protein